ncbi:MAG: sensor box histidine kinase, partial [Solirubrobacterales bacterium]|nr:sensor box histidine kinase [Solirubrobacterales bacterium]
QQQDRVFRMFARLHGRDEYAGAGVGLSLCRRIAERHGGHISLVSEPGTGSVFSVWLPQ